MNEEQFLQLLQVLTGLFVGAVIGSFITMLIYRVPVKQSIVRPRSFCPACRKQLRALDLIPIYSYIAYRGVCRYCGDKIGPQYLAIEVFCAIIGITLMLIYGFNLSALVFAVYLYTLFALILIRLKI